jgi:hypothetical protein
MGVDFGMNLACIVQSKTGKTNISPMPIKPETTTAPQNKVLVVDDNEVIVKTI